MLRKIFSFFILLIGCNTVYSQCFQVADGNGVMSSNPYFVSCTPGGFTVFIQTDQTIGPYTIDWGDGTLNASGPSLVPPAIEQHTYAATTDTFNLVITNTADGCVVNGVVVLERNPLASIQLPAGDDNFGCTPIQFRFINSSTQISQTTTFTWDFGDGSPTETYDYTNQNTIVTHTYMPGVGVQSCNLEVRLTATNYCGSSTASFFPLRVWDLDEARITPSSDLLCYPDTVVQYTNNTIRNCFPEGNQSQRYEYWNFGDYWGLGHDSIINWRPWNPPIINPPPMAYPGVGIYSVMLIDSSFCGKDTSVINIEITNPPTAVLGASKDTICEGQSITFTNNSIGGANRYYWDYGQGAGFVQRNGSNKTVTFNQHGDYTIQLAVGVAGASSCVDTTSVDIYVNPSPVANFNFTPNNQCDSATVSFTNTSTGTIVYWKWFFGNGNDYLGENPPAQFYGSAGSYTVKLLTRNNQGCLDSISKTVRIREIPTADFSVSSVCLNQLAQFQDLSVSTTDPITTYKWYFGDGDSSSLQNPSHLYTSFGDYTVVQIVDNGYCQDTDTLNVKVENNPTAAFSVDKESGCSRLTVNFTNQSSVNATSFTWNFGDGSALVNARDTFHTFTNASNKDTSFIVQMIAATTFGCADTTYDTISVYPVPIPSFTSDAVANCGPVTVNFTNTTQGDSLSFRWNFGDGTAIVNDTNPTHVFQNKTLFISNYQVQLIVISNNGCRDTTTRTVTIYPEPIFTFQINPDSGCSPLRVNFPSVVGAVDYQWDFGDGNTGTGASPNHTYVNNTTNDLNLSVRLVARNSFGCRDTTYGNVLVYPSPTSDFSLDTNKGCQPLPIVVTNNSTGANHFFWTYGDGSSDTTANAIFTKTYSNTTSVTDFNSIELITTTDKGCRDTSTRVVQVHPFVKAAYLSDSVGCSPLKVSFINQSLGGSSILWKFGDGAQTGSLNSNHTYNNTSNNNQNYLSKLIITSPQGCVDSAQRNILVYPKPIADYTLSDSIGCHPLPISISNNSINADSCIWKYGDGSNWNTCAASLQHTFTNTTSFFPLTYQSRLIVLTNHGCRDTLSKNIIVNPQVIADFNSDTAGCSPYPVSFQNQSIGGQNYNWTFGDGGNSFNTSPSHLFTNPVLRDTSFAVKLKVISQYNCTDSLTQNITVYPKPIA
ncbi:MAG: PKD domain-containing protein, partial [Flavobacteriales bacterium]|nr:PKD domain-containing protein [Flavobacteriales bacterium]